MDPDPRVSWLLVGLGPDQMWGFFLFLNTYLSREQYRRYVSKVVSHFMGSSSSISIFFSLNIFERIGPDPK